MNKGLFVGFIVLWLMNTTFSPPHSISESDSFNRLLAELAPANNDASLTASESFDKTVAL